MIAISSDYLSDPLNSPFEFQTDWLIFPEQVQQFGPLCDNGAGDLDERLETIHEKRYLLNTI